MKYLSVAFLFMIMIYSCHDTGPDLGPYDDIIGTYSGNMFIQDHQYDFPASTWTSTFDTINYTYIIEGVEILPNGALKLVVPQSPYHYSGTKEEFSQDTLSFQDGIGSLGHITEWLTIFRKEHKIEIRSMSTNNGSWYRETMYVGYQ